MIVDDNPLIRRALREVFEGENLAVCDAANGAEGIETAQDVKPSVIILDLSMPVMNGLETARKLKVLMPDVPLLMFTNYSGAITMEKEARNAGISGVFCKSDPESSKQLLAHVKMLLGFDGSGIRRVS